MPSRTATATALALAFTTHTAHAALSFDFDPVIDSTGAFTNFSNPAINNLGAVAFTAQLDSGEQRVLRVSGLTLSTIASSSSFAIDAFSPDDPVTINDAGAVAFRVTNTTQNLIGLGTGFSLSFLDTTEFTFSPPVFIDANNTRLAYLESGPLSGNNLILSANNTTQTLYTSVALAADFAANTSDQFVFQDNALAGRPVLLRDDDASVSTLTDTTDPAIEDINRVFDRNNAQQTLFLADPTGPQSTALFRLGPAGIPVPLADSNNYTQFFEAAINDNGDFAFLARPNSDPTNAGIYLGRDPERTKVIAEGDTLFGSTVTQLGFDAAGLANNNTLAFSFTLADGLQGIATTVIPSPATAALLAPLAIAATRRR